MMNFLGQRARLMRKLLTAIDVKILQALGEVGPRNLTKVARTVGLSRTALEFRIRRMRSDPQFFLRMYTSVYHTNLGLKKAVVIMEAEPGKEQLLFDCLQVNGFWLYVCRSYGVGEGCTAIYAIPVEYCSEFEQFIHEMMRLGVARDARIYWSTCFQGGRITSDWFDSSKQGWVFRWNDWMKEMQTPASVLPYTLMEPKEYRNYADELDVKMLEKLEEDATRSLKEISETLGISRQLACHRYKKHLIGKNLIEGYEVFVMRYGSSPSIMVLFIIDFHEYEAFAKFARSLLDKFFVITMGKILGENALLVEVFLPTEEFRKFIDALSLMAKMKLLRSYKYAIQDLRIRCRQTISPPLFKGNSWIYDYKNHMEMLEQKTQSK
jgi:DNA-binding Lrp family transcriptional regulator